jgi:hypothetical protein
MINLGLLLGNRHGPHVEFKINFQTFSFQKTKKKKKKKKKLTSCHGVLYIYVCVEIKEQFA